LNCALTRFYDKEIYGRGKHLFWFEVVELASFIAGPAAATILSDFGADVIKVEPPNGELWRHGQNIPPSPIRKCPIPSIVESKQAWRRAQFESCECTAGSRAASQVGRRVHRQHTASRAEEIELEYDDVAQWIRA